MAQKQSVAEQQERLADIRQQIESRKGTVFSYEIYVKNPNVSDAMFKHAQALSTRTPDIVEKFNSELDALLANRSTAVITVVLYGRNKKEKIWENTVVIREEYANTDCTLPIQKEQVEPQQPAQARPQQPLPGAQSIDRNLTVGNILTLMGFGGLAGDGDQTNGLNQILQVRDGLKDMSFENQRKDEKITKLTADLAATQQERDQLKKDIEKLERQLEKADERIENLELDIDDKNEQIRKLHPELSLMGTSLTALLGAGIKNFAMNHANTIGGLMGIDGDALRSMLTKDEETAAIGDGEAETDDNSDGRAEECKMIREFIKTLDEKEWSDFYQLMRVFAANKETIGIVLAMAKGSSDSGAPEQPNVEQ
ncbi:MAG: hypothetical protein J6U04_06290 [Salinivirgaceae bacterium]|nr:hypothetical protein [Salinivirgaceae bacterium]